MIDRVLHFGHDGSLVGIMTSPTEPRRDAPAVILVNSGLIHRVGPNRLYVTLARALKDMGFHSLRFDFSGVGDSRVTPGDPLSIVDRAQVDIQCALQAMREAIGAEAFVVMGLCSGAFMSHRTATNTADVVGCAQFDGHVYPTRRFYLRRYGPRVLNPKAWWRLLSRATPQDDLAAGPEHGGVFAPDMISRDQFAEDVAGLVERGTKLLFVLTRGGLQEVNYERQLQDCVPRVDLDRHAEILYLLDSDHTLTFERHRRAAVEATVRWMDRSFA